MHPVANLADQALVVGGGEDVVVEDVGNRRREVLVSLCPRLLVGLLEEVELELGARHRREAERGGPRHLRLEHLPRGRLNRRSVVPENVCEHERRGLEPGNPPKRGEIRLHREVAVTALPARDLVTGNRIHLHVERKQVVAPLDRVLVLDLVHEELRVEPLSHQSPLHVRERDDDRVDRAGVDLGLQLGEREHGRILVRAAPG